MTERDEPARPLPAGVVELVAGRLYTLCNPIELDGRPVTTHPLAARGRAPSNCHLLIDGEQALLIDTGYTAHREALLEQIGSLLGERTRLSLVLLRISEFNSVANARPIVEGFDVELLMGAWPDVAQWVDFDPEFDRFGSATPGGELVATAVAGISPEEGVPLAGFRPIEVLRPELKLLPTYWLFDAATGTLFTSDAFTHAWRAEGEGGGWVVGEDERPPSEEELIEYLLGTRFWWLAGARTEPLRESLREIFEGREIERIAPAWGCVLEGRGTVRRHLAVYDAALAELARRPSIGVDLLPQREELRR